MSDFDDLLALVESSTNNAAPEPVISEPVIEETPEPVMEEQPSEEIPVTSNLSDDDFSEILSDMGFVEESGEEGEEEENTEDSDWEGYHENAGEVRDLDAEEDADWQEAIDSGGIVPVPHSEENSEGNQPDTHQSPQEDNVYFHMPNEEVIAVPIIHEEEQELHEPEQAAIEAHQAVVEEAPQPEATIPLNSPTLLMDETTTRFSGAEWFSEIQKKRIIVAGIGGIGSWLAIQLARMTPAALYLYDDDNVESVNLAGQLYCKDSVGKAKVDAITDTLTSYTSMSNIFAIKERFESNTEAADIMMCGFDNMRARRAFYGAWLTHVASKPAEERKNCLYLDGRLSMNILQVFCIAGDDNYNQVRYDKEFLFDDSEAEETVCSMKQTTYLACMIGSVMTNLFTNWVANSIDPIIPYDLPFFTEYDAQNMIFKTEK